MQIKKIAIVGTNGIPAQYGGFETLAEQLVLNGYMQNRYVVYCSSGQKRAIDTYDNVRLVYLPLKANGWQGIFYDILSVLHSMFVARADIVLYLGPGFGLISPFVALLKKKIIVNHGGLNEWERPKLSNLQRKYAYWSHRIASIYATYNVVDNSILGNSLSENFGSKSVVIRYGGNHSKRSTITSEMLMKYPFLSESYCVSVSRAQEDNNIHIVLEAFRKSIDYKIVLISNWGYSEYGRNLKAKYSGIENIILLDAIYDKVELNAIRGNAKLYIHSHSHCGTAPSLVEAICLGLPIVSYDVDQNRETLENRGAYFITTDELCSVIHHITESDLSIMATDSMLLSQKYEWSKIYSEYYTLFQ